MIYQTDDLRIRSTKVVLPPVFLEEELPATERASATVFQARNEIVNILRGTDSRLMVVVGPCSIHDTKAAREYAGLLKGALAEFSKELCIIMRVYFEKPRTTLGWKGLINDPYLDQSFRINDGLRLARHLLLDLAEMGVPAGTEFLDMISPQYVAELVSWGAIGARTTESQVHRQLSSGLSCPVGFKNGTSGNVQIAIEAIVSAGHPHTFRGQSGLSHHPARRQADNELRRCSCGPNCRADGKSRRRAAYHDRLQPRQQQQGPHPSKPRVPQCGRTDCRGRPPDPGRDVGEQSCGGGGGGGGCGAPRGSGGGRKGG